MLLLLLLPPPPLASLLHSHQHHSLRNIKLISERSVALSKYFSQLCTLPQVVTSQPFQSFFEVHACHVCTGSPCVACVRCGARVGCVGLRRCVRER